MRFCKGCYYDGDCTEEEQIIAEREQCCDQYEPDDKDLLAIATYMKSDLIRFFTKVENFLNESTLPNKESIVEDVLGEITDNCIRATWDAGNLFLGNGGDACLSVWATSSPEDYKDEIVGIYWSKAEIKVRHSHGNKGHTTTHTDLVFNSIEECIERLLEDIRTEEAIDELKKRFKQISDSITEWDKVLKEFGIKE